MSNPNANTGTTTNKTASTAAAETAAKTQTATLHGVVTSFNDNRFNWIDAHINPETLVGYLGQYIPGFEQYSGVRGTLSTIDNTAKVQKVGAIRQVLSQYIINTKADITSEEVVKPINSAYETATYQGLSQYGDQALLQTGMFSEEKIAEIRAQVGYQQPQMVMNQYGQWVQVAPQYGQPQYGYAPQAPQMAPQFGQAPQAQYGGYAQPAPQFGQAPQMAPQYGQPQYGQPVAPQFGQAPAPVYQQPQYGYAPQAPQYGYSQPAPQFGQAAPVYGQPAPFGVANNGIC